MALPWAQIAKVATPLLIDYLGTNTATKNASAYQDYLNSVSGSMENALTNRAAQYEGKLGEMATQGETQYMGEANTPLAELTQMKTDLANQSAEAQRQNRLQTQNQLNASGVRGGQAAILQNRATGELNRDLQRDINSLAYDEAARRQGSRLNYLGTKAITPWSDLSQTYGANSRSAMNALSGAQGGVYGDAYGIALRNYPSTQKRTDYSSISKSLGM